MNKRPAISRKASVLFLLIVPLAIPFWSACGRAETDLGTRFQDALDAYRKQYGFPGATAAYVLVDGTVGTATSGVADKESGRPMMSHSRMLAASIGKTFVGATVIALGLAGSLDLDDPLSLWLGDRPWFGRLPNNDTITLRHLLTHSSGLPDHVHLDQFAVTVSRRWREKVNPFSPEDLIQFVLDLPPLFEPGQGWAYTDTGYILIGLVIEKAAGKKYYEVIKDLFLLRLGLTWTAPADSRSLPGLVPGYMATDNAFGFPPKTTTEDGRLAWHPGFEWTGGGLVSNSPDLARWGSALFGGKATSGSYLDQLLDSVPTSPETPDIRYGLGVGIYRKGQFGPVYGHGGWIPGYITSLRYYPDFAVTIAFQINTDIGIVDNSASVVPAMEEGLAEVVISSIVHRDK